ncbi:MAG: hypothetical protein C0410_11485 [Anaerolinea sp.]|nr:hypothetical protein [Anaerolinea sp.]
MIEINRFDIADFASPERIVEGIICKIPDLPVPVPVEEIALMLDIISIKELETEGYEGALVTDVEKSKGFILVNMVTPVQRRRFTIGHELGHFLCPSHRPISGNQFLCSSDDMLLTSAREQGRAVRMELEANRFAASLLMPLPHFRKDLRLHKGADIEHILSLARRYETSKEATARRYVDVQDEPLAILVSQNGRILRFYKAEDFPYLDVRCGNPVPQGSLTHKPDLTKGVPSEQEELDGSIWLSMQRGRRSPMIYEQVLHQSDGYRLTLLTLAEDPEELEEEEDLRDSWAPRFKR